MTLDCRDLSLDDCYYLYKYCDVITTVPRIIHDNGLVIGTLVVNKEEKGE